MKKENFLLFYIILTISLLFVSGGLVIGIDHVDDENTYFVVKNLIAISYSLTCILSIVGLFKFLNFMTIILILIHCICLFGQIYFINIRLYYALLIILFTLSAIHLLLMLIFKKPLKYKKYDNVNTNLLNGILPTSFIGFSLFVETFRLMDLLEMGNNKLLTLSFFVALPISIIALVIYLICVKDRTDKKKYFGAMTGTLFGTLILILLLFFGLVNDINYAFDTSKCEVIEVEVLDKYKTHSSRSRTGHYLVLMISGEEIDFKVNKIIYEKYSVEDQMILYKYEGSLGYYYYEYRLDFAYVYDNE